ncbi:ribonuclease H [Bacteroidales bacterium]|nr:ribonuclease H [Bacteroidales bacterium]
MAKSKSYVVWKGVMTGVFDSWEKCKFQVDNFEGALYKSFASREIAEKAFADGPGGYLKKKTPEQTIPKSASSSSTFIRDSLAVDAACSGNPGPMEYRGVYISNGQEVFRIGPLAYGTNNVGEFLAIVHGLALLKQKAIDIPIYTDSVNAMLWVKNKKCKTKLAVCDKNKEIFDLIQRAEKWLRENTYDTKIIKWETDKLGEIPADFGRK